MVVENLKQFHKFCAFSKPGRALVGPRTELTFQIPCKCTSNGFNIKQCLKLLINSETQYLIFNVFSAFSEFGNKSEKSQYWFPQDIAGNFKCSAFLICASNRREDKEK